MGNEVGRQQQQAADEGGQGQDTAGVSASNRPRRVRGHQADECDGAGDGHGPGSQDPGQPEQRDSGRLQREAERATGFVVKLQDVGGAGSQQCGRDGDGSPR